MHLPESEILVAVSSHFPQTREGSQRQKEKLQVEKLYFSEMNTHCVDSFATTSNVNESDKPTRIKVIHDGTEKTSLHNTRFATKHWLSL